MGHYKANLRDLEFNLFEVLRTQDKLGNGAFKDLDEDTARDFLAQIHKLAEGPFADSFEDGDRNPPTYDPATFSAKLPEKFKQSFKALMESGSYYLDLDPDMGGTPAPRSLWWCLAEMVLGSNPSLWIYAAGPAFNNIFYGLATPEQKEWARIFIDKLWGATMVLTEPDAGSDVGAGTTKAFQQPDGSWHIEGVKRFITSADQDITDNIIHYVLARPEGVPGAGGPGTKGLSLFVVPKFEFDPKTGELGERNGAFVTNVEHKMGLKVSTTCELSLGQHDIPAKGWLVGDIHDGIRQMFKIIEYARMFVGTKAMATLSSGYLNALDYAKTRKQGPDLTRQTDKSAPRVEIIRHPDVRRSLMLQKSYAEGLRALDLYTASVQDQVQIARYTGDADAEKKWESINDLLLPLVKGFGSERAWTLLGTESLQTFGGSGFLQDYPIEQYVRDAKIDTLYEGTTAIQGMDFFFRKFVRDNGKSLMHVAGQIQEFVAADNGRLKEERALLATALGDVQAMLGAMIGDLTKSPQDPASIYKVGQNTSRLLLSMGDMITGWLLQKHAVVAMDALDRGPRNDADRDFYEGKIASARFFATQVLPKITAERVIVESTDNALMEIPDAAF